MSPTNHVQNVLLHRLPLVVPAGPIIPRSASMTRQVCVLGVEQILHV